MSNSVVTQCPFPRALGKAISDGISKVDIGYVSITCGLLMLMAFVGVSRFWEAYSTSQVI